MTEQWFVLDVNPEPWEIGPLNVVRKGGSFRPFVGRSQTLDDYKKSVREAVKDQPHKFMEGKLSLTCWFWRQRPEYETAQARRHRSHEADDTNMFKATEDALQGLLYDNDKNNREIHGYIVDQGPHVNPGIIIRLKPAPGVVEMLSPIPPDVLSRLWADRSAPVEDDRYTRSNPQNIF